MPPDQDTAGLPFPPPVIPGVALLGAVLLGWLVPANLGISAPLFGGTAMLAAVGVLGWAFLTLREAGTDIRPDRPTTALVQHGPFAFSRNPVYLAMALFVAGAALEFGSLWLWLAAIGVPVALQRVVILREEAYLARKFGEPYAAYCARVRRWI